MILKGAFPDYATAFSRQQERELKRMALLSVAAELMDRDGVHAARLEDIAARLGMTKNIVGYYFTGKDELVTAVFEQSVLALEGIATAAAAAPSAGGKIRAFLAGTIDLWSDVAGQRRPRLISLAELSALQPEARQSVAGRISAVAAQVNGWVEAWRTQTPVPVGRAEPVTSYLFNLAEWIRKFLVENPHTDPVAFRATVLSVGEQGLGRAATAEAMRTPGVTPTAPEIFDREARNRMKRAAFLRSGTKLFNSLGYDGVSLGEIAQSIGVTRGAFYYHFPDKEQLLLGCLEQTFDALDQYLRRVEGAGLSPIASVRSLVKNIVYEQLAGVVDLAHPGLAAKLPAPFTNKAAARFGMWKRGVGAWIGASQAERPIAKAGTPLIEDLVSHIIFLGGGLPLGSDGSPWRTAEAPDAASSDYVYLLFEGIGTHAD